MTAVVVPIRPAGMTLERALKIADAALVTAAEASGAEPRDELDFSIIAMWNHGRPSDDDMAAALDRQSKTIKLRRLRMGLHRKPWTSSELPEAPPASSTLT